MKKDKPHFRVMISVIEVGMGEEMAYTTEIESLSFPKCHNYTQAKARMQVLTEYYEEQWLKGSPNPKKSSLQK